MPACWRAGYAEAGDIPRRGCAGRGAAADVDPVALAKIAEYMAKLDKLDR